MRLRPHDQQLHPQKPGASSGSAVLIVLVLLGLMSTLIISNSVVLRRIKVELQLLEEKQNRALKARAEALSSQAGIVPPGSEEIRRLVE